METRLLTYAELADALGITAASAKRLAIRRRWPKQPGNDGRSRVLVPVERLLVERTPATGDGTGDSTSDVTSAVTNEAISDGTGDRLIVITTTLTRHIERLEHDLTAAKAERDRAAARAAEAAVVPALRTTIDALKVALDSE